MTLIRAKSGPVLESQVRFFPELFFLRSPGKHQVHRIQGRRGPPGKTSCRATLHATIEVPKGLLCTQ